MLSSSKNYGITNSTNKLYIISEIDCGSETPEFVLAVVECFQLCLNWCRSTSSLSHPARPCYLLLEVKELLPSESCHFGTGTRLPFSRTAGAGSEHCQLKTQQTTDRGLLTELPAKKTPWNHTGSASHWEQVRKVEVKASHSQ